MGNDGGGDDDDDVMMYNRNLQANFPIISIFLLGANVHPMNGKGGPYAVFGVSSDVPLRPKTILILLFI